MFQNEQMFSVFDLDVCRLRAADGGAERWNHGAEVMDGAQPARPLAPATGQPSMSARALLACLDATQSDALLLTEHWHPLFVKVLLLLPPSILAAWTECWHLLRKEQ